MEKYLLGIDVGSTSVKAVLFDTKGNVISSASAHNEREQTSDRIHGFEIFNVENVWKSTYTCVNETIEKSKIESNRIAALSVCSFGNGVVILDKNGNPADKGAFSQDYRANHIIEQYKKEGKLDKINEIIKGTLFAGEPAPILRWYKENEPEIYNNIGSVLMCKDYIIYKLTGALSADVNCFGGSAMLDLETRNYSKELMHLYGIDEMYYCLPKLLESYEVAGTVTSDASKLTSLAQGTPVVSGMMDILAGLVGAGAADEGIVTIIAGTWCINEIQSHKIIPGASANQPALGKNLYLNCSYTGASAVNYEWFAKALGGTAIMESKVRSMSKFDILNELVATVSPNEAQVLFHPFVAQPSVHPNARASFFNIDQNTSYAEMAYAVMEGVVFLHKKHIDFLKNAGHKITLGRLTGGGARSSVWAQMFADVLKIPIEVVDCQEVSALGAAINAGVGTGVYSDYNDGFAKAIRIKSTFASSEKYADAYYKRYKEWEYLIDCMSEHWNYRQ